MLRKRLVRVVSVFVTLRSREIADFSLLFATAHPHLSSPLFEAVSHMSVCPYAYFSDVEREAMLIGKIYGERTSFARLNFVVFASLH